MVTERVLEHIPITRLKNIEREKGVWEKQGAGQGHHGDLLGQNCRRCHGQLLRYPRGQNSKRAQFREERGDH
jgi:hypothetical protein